MAHEDQYCRLPPRLRSWIAAEASRCELDDDTFLASLVESARRGNGTDLTAPFRFVDLCAGIGGFRLGLERVGGRCAFCCDADRFARHTYEAWFGEEPYGDLRDVDPATIPDHDVLAAGFPCQPFSIAGLARRRTVGRPDGFDCPDRGHLFFLVRDVVAAKRPPVLLLENVKSLRSHDRGRTWRTIEGSLVELGYAVRHAIVDAAPWVPQHRERLFVVGLDERTFGAHPSFRFPRPPRGPGQVLGEILEPDPPARYTLTDRLWNWHREHAEKHRSKGNGYGYGLADPNGITRTLSARYHKDGAEILIPQRHGRNPRRLTIVEAARLMGFEEVVRRREDSAGFRYAGVPPVRQRRRAARRRGDRTGDRPHAARPACRDRPHVPPETADASDRDRRLRT